MTGAYMIERATHRLNELLQFDHSNSSTQQREEASNLLLLICHLYNLGLIATTLIFDIIRLLCDVINEYRVSLLIVLLNGGVFFIHALSLSLSAYNKSITNSV